MIEFFKKLFGVKTSNIEASVAPKAETPAPKVKKSTVKKATTRKPKAPKA